MMILISYRVPLFISAAEIAEDLLLLQPTLARKPRKP